MFTRCIAKSGSDPSDPSETGSSGAAESLLNLCRGLDIRLWTEAGRLRYDAPVGALDDALRAELVAHKAELIGRLAAEPEPAPEAEPEPADSYGQVMRDWLRDLLGDGSLLKHLGTWSEARARSLLERDELDVPAARDLIHRTMAKVWPKRYRAADVYHETLNPSGGAR